MAQPLDIRAFGAKGDGITLNTKSIQSAIDQAAKQGGGTVYVPSGRYLTGTLKLCSNLELHLSPGAVLLGSSKMADYETAHPNLIYGKKLDNVSLTGTGTIDGQGHYFYDTTQTVWKSKPRPTPWLLLDSCQRVRVRDLRLKDSPAHVLVLEHCKDVVVDGISVNCDMRSPNTDAIDVTDCTDVMISNCYLHSGDDLICLKSHDVMLQNITVTNCVLIGDDAALKFGTGSAKGMKNCVFSNITIHDTRYGIALFMLDGGTHEHCLFENITIRNKSNWTNNYPIFIDIHKRTPESKIGRIKDLHFRNINIQTDGNILVAGQPESPIEDIVFDNISMTLIGCSDMTQHFQKPRGNKTLVPIPGLVDYCKVPAQATFAHIRGLTLRDFTVRLAKKVPVCDREAIWMKDVEDAVLENIDFGKGLKTAVQKS